MGRWRHTGYWSAARLATGACLILAALVAMGISWLPLVAWVLYRALRYEDVSRTVHEQRELQAARNNEHTTVYEDDYQPRFQ